MKHRVQAVLVLASGALLLQDPIGYSDTPKLPNSAWRVHDGTRPQPREIAPGPARPDYGLVAPPADAVVLFDGRDLSAWTGGGGEPRWKLVDGAMEVNGTGSLRTRQEFGDIQLHVEFATPAEVKGDSQGRGNSGVFLMGRYEVQILDSFENPTYPDGQAAALYGQTPPLVNASRPPGQWQSYDIMFQAPRFADDGTVRQPARVTIFHNSVLVHHDRAYLGATGHRVVGKYTKHPERGPIELQDHGNPVRYRNIWLRELRGYDE
ncbi:MAG TPA: DUF1080 domain-containing protein [Planctomycetota bacterium]